MFVTLEKLDLLIIGNFIEGGKYTPEYVNIKIGQQRPSLASQDNIFEGDWYYPQIYGIVGTLFNENIYFCGGGALPTLCDIEGYLSTSMCRSFSLKTYNLFTLNIVMKEERTFAQSMRFENNTWLIMGGEDSQGAISDTIEYLDVNGTNFIIGHKMPEYFSRHCAKMLNSSHLFTTGGSKQSTSTRG